VCKKADKTTVFQDFTITDELNGKISTILSSQSVAVLGNVDSELKIYGLNSELLTSVRFVFRVVPSLLDESTVISTNEFSALTDALTDVEQAKLDVAMIGPLHAQIQDDITDGDAVHVTLTSDISEGNALKDDLGLEIATGETTHTTLQADIALAQQNTFAAEVTQARGSAVNLDTRIVTIEQTALSDKADYTLRSDIKGTTQNVTLNTAGDVTKVQHINVSSVVIREDVFTYATNLITEVRTILASGLTVMYKYHTDTLATEVI